MLINNYVNDAFVGDALKGCLTFLVVYFIFKTPSFINTDGDLLVFFIGQSDQLKFKSGA